uniref:Ig-like domain-containing protein n=1 Tax=Chelonoidis abingdonii TaxID=106734 RepID=A0A8C0H7J0_CHEAB
PWSWGALTSLRLLNLSPHLVCPPLVSPPLLDLRTHSMDCSTCKIRFLQPWAHQGLTPKQWQGLETVLHDYLSKFYPLMNKVVKDEDEHYPFVIQASIGCELHPNGTSRQFCDAAVNGEDFISFSVDEGTWVAQHRHKLALNSRDFLNQDKSTTNWGLSRAVLPTPDPGKWSWAWLVSPEAQTESTPAPVLLVCRVTGFYPRPVRMAWLQDGEEVVPGWRLNSSGILPNVDLTYQLRSSLSVGLGDGHSYACQVQHSSLGGQSLLIPWGHSRPWGPGLAVGITLGALAVATVAVVLWWRIRR